MTHTYNENLKVRNRLNITHTVSVTQEDTLIEDCTIDFQ